MMELRDILMLLLPPLLTPTLTHHNLTILKVYRQYGTVNQQRYESIVRQISQFGQNVT